MSQSRSIERLAAELCQAQRVTVLTGAGVSAASGVPTFRGDEGLWKSYRPESLATPEAFRSNPKLVWEWYTWRRRRISESAPNPAHRILARWSQRWEGFRLITQNVDGLHERAGTRSVVRFHGSIWEVLCNDDCPESPDRWRDETLDFPMLPPPCPYCRGLLRPGVVWFGEGIPVTALRQSNEALDCELFLTVGTSSLVHPAAALAGSARLQGAFTAEINLDATPVSDQLDVSIRGRAEVVLDEIDALL